MPRQTLPPAAAVDDEGIDAVAHAMVTRAERPAADEPERPMLLCGTGITLLNLALSGDAAGGWAVGKMYNVVGDKSTGKTLMALSALAEAAHNPAFDSYGLYHDDAEAACEFAVAKLFGRRLADRLRPPPRGEASHTIEDWRASILQLLDAGEPFIYVLDSFDSLTTREEVDLVNEHVRADLAGTKQKGTYGMARAKINSQLFRIITSRLAATRSILLIISQTRQSINAGPFEPQTYRAGGAALDFYSSGVIWLNVRETLRRETARYIVGQRVNAKIEKNKLTGRRGVVSFCYLYDYGLDDVRACIDWLVEAGVWTKTGQGRITPRGAGSLERIGVGTADQLAKRIDAARALPALRRVTAAAWAALMERLKPEGRTPRYV